MNIQPDKSQNVLGTLRSHLENTYPNLAATLPLSQIRIDTLGNISMVMPLKSRAEPSNNTTKGCINMGLPLDSPTFMLQFQPISIDTVEELPSPSSKSIITVSVATYHGLVLRKDRFEFFMNFNNPNNFDEAELQMSTCQLLNRIEHYPLGFRLCAGLDEPEFLDAKKVFIEPFGEHRDLVVVRSRKCEYMLELEDIIDMDDTDIIRTTCVPCSLFLNDSICTTIKSEFPPSRKTIFEDESEPEEEEDLVDDGDTLEDFLNNESDKMKDPDWRTVLQRKPLTQITDDMYCCDHCNQHFKTERALLRHKDQITSSKYCCDKCNRRFKLEVILEDHKTKCTGSANASKKSRKKKKALSASLTKKSRKQGGGSATKKSLVSDENKAAESQTCPLCFLVFTMNTRFEHHMELHKERMPELNQETQCPASDCDLTFPNRVDLCNHYQKVHDQDAAPCGKCLKVFKKTKMRSHLFTDHPTKKYPCQICHKVLPFLSHLKQHTKDVHAGDRARDIVCHHCGNQYRREAGLRQHLASAHSDERKFLCPYKCGKGFTTQTRLTQHIRIHTGSKPFKCKLCDYKSNRADNVLIHVRKVHKKPNPDRHQDMTVIQETKFNELQYFKIESVDTSNNTIVETTTTLEALVS